MPMATSMSISTPSLFTVTRGRKCSIKLPTKTGAFTVLFHHPPPALAPPLELPREPDTAIQARRGDYHGNPSRVNRALAFALTSKILQRLWPLGGDQHLRRLHLDFDSRARPGWDRKPAAASSRGPRRDFRPRRLATNKPVRRVRQPGTGDGQSLTFRQRRYDRATVNESFAHH